MTTAGLLKCSSNTKELGVEEFHPLYSMELEHVISRRKKKKKKQYNVLWSTTFRKTKINSLFTCLNFRRSFGIISITLLTGFSGGDLENLSKVDKI